LPNFIETILSEIKDLLYNKFEDINQTLDDATPIVGELKSLSKE